MDGVLFGAKYLGSTQLLSERNPPPSTRMGQAQEAMDRVKVSQGRVPRCRVQCPNHLKLLCPSLPCRPLKVRPSP